MTGVSEFKFLQWLDVFKAWRYAPENEHFDQAHEAGDDAEGARLFDHVGVGHVRLKLLVRVSLATERAHKLHDGAVDERRFDLRGVLLALGKSWSPICTNTVLKNGTRTTTWSALSRRCCVIVCLGDLLTVSRCGVFNLKVRCISRPSAPLTMMGLLYTYSRCGSK